MNYHSILNNEGISYGIIKGNNSRKIVFIKAGLGKAGIGKAEIGLENMEEDHKYKQTAFQLYEKFGCHIIAASNPNDGKNHTEIDRQIIEQYILENHLQSPDLLFLGSSNGCIKGLMLANQGVVFKKMVLVNMPLMINFHKTKQFISSIPQTQIVVIMGDRDPSFKYLPFLDGRFENVKISTVKNADHTFQGMTHEFISLGELLME